VVCGSSALYGPQSLHFLLCRMKLVLFLLKKYLLGCLPLRNLEQFGSHLAGPDRIFFHRNALQVFHLRAKFPISLPLALQRQPDV
jgi:hypothetical protein